MRRAGVSIPPEGVRLKTPLFAILGSFSQSYPAARESVTRARRDVTGFVARHRVSAEQLDAVRSAVSEAVSNAVLHAYRGRKGSVHVTVNLTGVELWVLVADDGCGFQSESETPGLGWGLALIAQATDEFVLAERAQGGTEARMRFSMTEPVWG